MSGSTKVEFDPDEPIIKFSEPVYILSMPEYVMEIDFFGDNASLCLRRTKDQIPSAWVRFWMRIFFNSKFKRLDQ